MLAARSRARGHAGNPIAEDEARRLGERADSDPDEPPPSSVDEAASRLAAVLPIASRETWMALPDGRWVCRETGLVADEPPKRCTV